MAAKKKQSSSSDKQTKATVRSLRSKLERAEAKAARWKDEAKSARADVAALTARVAKLDKKLAKARGAEHALVAAHEAGQAGPGDHPGPEQTGTPDAGAPVPDASWTVAELRAEARSRGLTGLSNKPKADLVAALT